MKKKVYLESSIFSYLVGRPSTDTVVAAHQKLTARWWKERRSEFDVFVGPPVLDECARGDRDAARLRLVAVRDIPLLEATPKALALAQFLIRKKAVPAKAAIDALHIALAAVHGMSFLLTWNCRHIANAEVRPLVEDLLRGQGYDPPDLCTPEELMGVSDA